MDWSAQTWRLRYSDGAGNAYVFEQPSGAPARWSRTPVRPALSSSGIYDGGPAFAEVELGPERAAELWMLAEALAADTDSHQQHRAMGTGLLSWDRGHEQVRVILAPGVGHAFEALLCALVDEATAAARVR